MSLPLPAALWQWAVLCRRDIERMRQPAGVLSSEEIARLKHEAEAELEGQRAVAKARKEKMLKVCRASMLLRLDMVLLFRTFSRCCGHQHS